MNLPNKLVKEVVAYSRSKICRMSTFTPPSFNWEQAKLSSFNCVNNLESSRYFSLQNLSQRSKTDKSIECKLQINIFFKIPAHHWPRTAASELFKDLIVKRVNDTIVLLGEERDVILHILFSLFSHTHVHP